MPDEIQKDVTQVEQQATSEFDKLKAQFEARVAALENAVNADVKSVEALPLVVKIVDAVLIVAAFGAGVYLGHLL